MRVAIDARYLDGTPSGIGRYSENLLRALGDLNTETEWHVVVHEKYDPPPQLKKRMRFYPARWRPLSAGTLLRIGKKIDALGCDVAHVLCPVIPLQLKLRWW
jgi:hypothetical protein